jgi:hypothetical protein
MHFQHSSKVTLVDYRLDVASNYINMPFWVKLFPRFASPTEYKLMNFDMK